MSRIFKIILLTTLIFYLITFLLQAQTITPKFDELTVGIPNCVLQDKNGFIWIGAQEGLLRYDGYDFKKYKNKPFDSTSLSANWVTALAEDKYGNLWVGTISGLNYFDKLTEKFVQFKMVDKNDSTLSAEVISKTIIDENGLIWIGTFDHGLFCAKENSTGKPEFTHYNLADSSYSRDSQEKFWIIELYKNDSDNLWIGTKFNGLKRVDLNTGMITHFRHSPNNPEGLSHNTVRSICADSLGNIWIGTGEESVKDGGGLNMYNPQTGKFINFRYNRDDRGSLPSDRIFPIYIDSKEVLWMGFYDKGFSSIPVSKLLGNKNPDFRNSTEHPMAYIQNIYEDRSNNIWFAQIGWTLYKYDLRQNPFSWYHQEKDKINTMSSTGVQCIFIDRLQNIWFGHHSPGLDKYNPKTGIYTNYVTHPNFPVQLSVTSICEDNKGFLWLASLNNGLYRMDPGKETFQRIHSDPKNSDEPISESLWYMLMSKTGKLWIASIDKGLFLFDPITNNSRNIDFKDYGVENGRVSSMFEDQDGTIWLGTFGKGFYGIQIENDEIQTIKNYVQNRSERNSLSYNSISDIIRPTILDTNALWIATTNGLNRFDLESKTFTHFFKKDGIPDNLVLKILEDNEGNIWSVHLRELSKYIIKTGEWRNYGIKDGMPFETFGGSRQNTAKSKDGQLFFSGGSGTIGFYPDQIKDNPFIPPIYFTDFKIFNESVKLDTSVIFKKVIKLTHNQNAFSFEFAALNYTNAKKNQYKYKMEGFHNDWIYIGNEHTASFTNLDPGEYIFRVKGSNNHGIWNEEGTSLLIIITPPWWATWWFKTLIILTIIGIGYSIYRYRINKVLEMERLRIQIASDLHDDIGSALTRIAVHSEIIQTTTEKEKVSSASKRIGNMSREIITTLSDVVWSIDSRNDTVGDLIDRMRDFLETVFPAGSIHIDFQTKGLHFDQKIEQTLRQNIYLIFKEAVNNAAKHSGADEITISMINGDGKFKMEIADNGTGINEEEKQKGHHGIENMELRAKRINGELIINNLEKGTSVTLIAKNI